MRIEYIYIFQIHALQTLVEARKQVFATSPLAIRSGPHQVTSFGRNDQFITVRSQIELHNFSKIFFSRSGRRTVIIGQVEMGYSQVECTAAHGPTVLKDINTTEIVPQTQRYGRKF